MPGPSRCPMAGPRVADQAAGGGGRTVEVLDMDACLGLLSSRYVGRLAYVRDGLPQVLPFNYVLDDGVVVLRTGPGELVDGLPRPAAFEVDDADTPSHRGWSVVVHGRAEEVVEEAELEAVRALPLRPWAPGSRAHYIRVLSRSITGRRIC
jgi:uncharacterized protein